MWECGSVRVWEFERLGNIVFIMLGVALILL